MNRAYCIFVVRNMNNGNSHRIQPLTWDEADRFFRRATHKGLAAAICPVPEFNTGVYHAQNTLHYKYEEAYCYYNTPPSIAKQYAENKLRRDELKAISKIS
jgi:hypothetical protein